MDGDGYALDVFRKSSNLPLRFYGGPELGE